MYGMNQAEAVNEAIRIAGGFAEVARLRACSVENVRVWSRKGAIPAEHVIGLAEAIDWQVTPHQLSPGLYPHAGDGMPPPARAAVAEPAAPSIHQ